MTGLYRDKNRPAPSISAESESEPNVRSFFSGPAQVQADQELGECGARGLVAGPFENMGYLKQ